MIEQTLNNGVLTMRLAYGKASALDVQFLEGISAALSEAAANDDGEHRPGDEIINMLGGHRRLRLCGKAAHIPPDKGKACDIAK